MAAVKKDAVATAAGVAVAGVRVPATTKAKRK
jgi:hypothetical protein